MTLENDILNTLSNEGMKVTSLLAQLNLDSNNKPKINSILYKLKAEKKVNRIVEDGKVYWSKNEAIDKILNYLREQDKPASTLSIAKAILGKDARAKDINPSLYALEKKGLVSVSKDERGGKPHWSIIKEVPKISNDDILKKLRNLKFVTNINIIAEEYERKDSDIMTMVEQDSNLRLMVWEDDFYVCPISLIDE